MVKTKWDMPVALVALASMAAVVASRGPGAEAAELCLFLGLLAHMARVDIATRTIPDACVAGAWAVRLCYLALMAARGVCRPSDLLFYLLSALGVGAVLLALVLLADRLMGRDSMGGGDLKLIATSALYFGWMQCLPLVMLACVLGIASSALTAFSDVGEGDGGGGGTFPFGPAIALSCAVTMLCGERVVGWYLGLLA